MRKRIALVAALALALVGLVGGTVAYSAMNKTVTLSVDGKVEEVKTFDSTVEEILAEEDINVGEHDQVAPSLDSNVEDGTRIAVGIGREINLSVDGEEESHWVTATRVGPALEAIGKRFAGAELSSSRSAPIGREGLDLTVKTAKDVTLVNAGKKSKQTTTAVTVREALQDLDVKHDRNDEVRPGRQAGIEDGDRVRVVDIKKETRKVKVDKPNETVVRYSDSMLKGKEKVERPGRDGVRLDTHRVVLADGDQRSRKKVDSAVRAQPIDRVEIHGTKDPPQPPESGSEPESGDGWVAPLDSYSLTATFGEIGLWSSGHTGLDFDSTEGVPVGSVASGEVTSAGDDGSFGQKVVVTHADGTETWYAHLSEISVSVGDQVGAGSTIGAVGATGNVTGSHLHLEVRPGGGEPVDPYTALQEHGVDL